MTASEDPLGPRGREPSIGPHGGTAEPASAQGCDGDVRLLGRVQ